MSAITGASLISGAFNVLGMYEAGESPTAAESSGALRRLNNLIRRWSLEHFTIPFVARTVKAITANQASYTVGTGGDINIVRPAVLEGVGLLLNDAQPFPVEIPRGLMSDDAWQAVPVKDLTNPLFTDGYYNPTYSGQLGTLTLWPVPTDDTTSVVVYALQQLGTFADTTTSYDVPDGYEEALEYQLALRLATPYGRPIPPELPGLAASALAVIKRANAGARLNDVPQDPAYTHDRKGGYNIVTGQGS